MLNDNKFYFHKIVIKFHSFINYAVRETYVIAVSTYLYPVCIPVTTTAGRGGAKKNTQEIKNFLDLFIFDCSDKQNSL